MNHVQLKAFHAVAETGGFSAAAKTLGLTQPAVTLQIQALEQAYNTKLFQRRGRRTEITASGELLLEIARKMLRLEEEAQRLLCSLGSLEAGQLSVITSSSLNSLPLVAAFQAQYPGIRITFQTTTADSIEKNILDFRANLAVHHAPPSDRRLFGVKVAEEPLKVAVARKNPWARRGSLTLRELSGRMLVLPFNPFTSGAVPPHWSKLLPRETDRTLCLQNKEIAREAVANDMGFTLFTESEIKWDTRLQGIEVEGGRMHEATYVIGLKGERESRLISSFLALCDYPKGDGETAA